MSWQHVSGAPMTVVFDRRRAGGFAVVTVRGELDLRSHTELREALLDEVDQGWNLIIDLSEVDFIDSTGLGLLVGVLKRARERDQHLGVERTQLVLVVATSDVSRTFEITGLDRVFTITDRLEDAEALI